MQERSIIDCIFHKYTLTVHSFVWVSGLFSLSMYLKYLVTMTAANMIVLIQSVILFVYYAKSVY